MKRRFAWMLLAGLLLMANPVLAEPTPDEVIAAIKKLGGKVTVDGNKAAITVRLGFSKITDAGLEHLKGLTELKELLLYNTKITDAGLEHLKGLTNLELLIIRHTQVTDAGLEHLKGLTELEVLDLSDTH
ncbi:MAG: hypothetical protein VB835_01430, partial [Pirellulales bacterium]